MICITIWLNYLGSGSNICHWKCCIPFVRTLHEAETSHSNNGGTHERPNGKNSGKCRKYVYILYQYWYMNIFIRSVVILGGWGVIKYSIQQESNTRLSLTRWWGIQFKVFNVMQLFRSFLFLDDPPLHVLLSILASKHTSWNT